MRTAPIPHLRQRRGRFRFVRRGGHEIPRRRLFRIRGQPPAKAVGGGHCQIARQGCDMPPRRSRERHCQERSGVEAGIAQAGGYPRRRYQRARHRVVRAG